MINTKPDDNPNPDEWEDAPGEDVPSPSVKHDNWDWYINEKCPYCEQLVWGTKDDLDSGMRKHIEYCEKAPTEDDDIGD